MSIRATGRPVGVTLVMAVLAPAAVGYIHFPPATLPQMCKASKHIRVLRVTKHDKQKGGILFEVVENLKGPKSHITSFRHILPGGGQRREAGPRLGQGR